MNAGQLAKIFSYLDPNKEIVILDSNGNTRAINAIKTYVTGETVIIVGEWLEAIDDILWERLAESPQEKAVSEWSLSRALAVDAVRKEFESTRPTEKFSYFVEGD